jgi:pilus assembly protein CpaB
MKQKIILLIALLAGLAAFVLSKRSFENFKQDFQKQFATVLVVAAARDIAPGTMLKLEDIGTKTVFAKAVTGRAVKPDEYTELVGKKTRTFLQREQPILWSDVDLPYGGLGGLSSMIVRGERAISIPVDQVASVTGHVRPNDHVDIIGTFSFPGVARAGGGGLSDTVTLTILQDVTVLATGKSTGRRYADMEFGDRFGGEQYATVTVAVTPREAEMLVFAHQKGKLALALRNREDVSVEKQLGNVDFQMMEKNFNALNAERQQRLHPIAAPLAAPLPAPPPAQPPALPPVAAPAPKR